MTVTRARDIVVPGLVTGLLAVGLLAGAACCLRPRRRPRPHQWQPPATYGCPGEPPWWAAGRCVPPPRAGRPASPARCWCGARRARCRSPTPGRSSASTGGVVAVPTGTADGRGLAVPLDALAGVDTRRLEVWLGADRLDRAGPVAPSLLAAGQGDAGAAGVRRRRRARRRPGRPRPLRRGGRGFDYSAAPLPWHEFDRSMEVLGHVVLPEGVDDAPLVLFLHGRHSPCYRPRGAVGTDSDVGARQWGCAGERQPIPSYLGYDYVQRLLATQGYASVSISANAVNAQDFDSLDGGAEARSALVRHHLDLLTRWAADPGRPRWFGRIDVGRTVLVGHSRGGEGVARATADAPSDAPWDIRGEVLVAPTNFARLATSFTPSVTLLPYCDGDVSDLQGEQYTDLARDLTAGDTAFRSSVLMRGANHNYFNTEWTPGISVAPSVDDWFDRKHPLCGDDSPTRLTAQQQRQAGKAWIAGAVRLFADDDTDMLAMLDAAGPVTVGSAGAESVRTHALGGDRTLVRPGVGNGPTGAGVLCRAIGRQNAFAPPCARGIQAQRMLHWYNLPVATDSPMELSLTWSSSECRRRARPRPAVGPVRARYDARPPYGRRPDDRRPAGPDPADRRRRGRVETNPRDLTGLTGGYIRTYWGQTLRVDPDNAPPRLDLDEVAAVTLVAASPEGRVWVVDAAARRPALRPVPDVRLSTFSLGPRVVVDEGDGPGEATATMTYTLDEPSPRPAKVTVAAATYDDRVMVRGITGARAGRRDRGQLRGPVRGRRDRRRGPHDGLPAGHRRALGGRGQPVLRGRRPRRRPRRPAQRAPGGARRGTGGADGVAGAARPARRLRRARDGQRAGDTAAAAQPAGLRRAGALGRRSTCVATRRPATPVADRYRDPGRAPAGGADRSRSWCPPGRTRRGRGHGC